MYQVLPLIFSSGTKGVKNSRDCTAGEAETDHH